MIEVVFDYNEFKEKVDLSKPIHHHAMTKSTDLNGVFYRIEFRLQGISKDSDRHVVMWIATRRTTISSEDREGDKAWYEQLVKKYAEPLGSTEGEWRE